MNRRLRLWLVAIVSTVVLVAGVMVAEAGLRSSASGTSAASATASSTSSPQHHHVFVVMMENRSYADVIQSGQAPYVSSLARNNGLATQYFPITRGSLPNYLALTGGGTFGHSKTCPPADCPIHAVNLLDRLEAAGKSWRAYMESMPWPCDSASAGRYEVGHNPFVYYDDIRNNPLRCDQNVVPLQQLGADLQSAATTPDFVWITPNLCHNMHDCSVQTGDAWLAEFLPQILQSAAFRQQDSLLVLTWDEGNFTHANQVATILVAPRHIQPGTRFAARSNDYSLLRTIESFWGLKPLQPNDAGAKPIVNLLRPR